MEKNHETARRLCRNDWAAGDDVAQEALIKAYAALPGYRGEAKFSVWMCRLVFNLAVSRRRKKDNQWATLDEYPHETGPCEQTRTMCEGDIQWAMAQLSESQQVAIGLCFEEDFPQEEASTIMHIPLGTLKTHVNRGSYGRPGGLNEF